MEIYFALAILTMSRQLTKVIKGVKNTITLKGKKPTFKLNRRGHRAEPGDHLHSLPVCLLPPGFQGGDGDKVGGVEHVDIRVLPGMSGGANGGRIPGTSLF